MVPRRRVQPAVRASGTERGLAFLERRVMTGLSACKTNVVAFILHQCREERRWSSDVCEGGLSSIHLDDEALKMQLSWRGGGQAVDNTGQAPLCVFPNRYRYIWCCVRRLGLMFLKEHMSHSKGHQCDPVTKPGRTGVGCSVTVLLSRSAEGLSLGSNGCSSLTV